MIWYHKGRVTRRTVKLIDSSNAMVQFSCPVRPVGASVEAPQKLGSESIDLSDEPIGVRIVAWTRDNDGTSVTGQDVSRFVNFDEPQPGAKLVGDGQIVAESAVHKRADGEGSLAQEYRFTLRVPIEEGRPFFATTLGALMANRSAVYSFTPQQVDLPEMPAREPRRRKGAKDEGKTLLDVMTTSGDVANAADDLLDAVAHVNPPPAVLPPDDDEPAPGGEAVSMIERANAARRRKAG